MSTNKSKGVSSPVSPPQTLPGRRQERSTPQRQSEALNDDQPLKTKDHTSEAYLRNALQSAVTKLEARDNALLKRDLHEVTVTARLAHYLAMQIEPGHDSLRVDCEYNRNGDDVKSQGNKNFRPDVIVHHRGKKEWNFLVVECKKTPSKTSERIEVRKDVQRLLKMLDDDRYRFQCAAFIEVNATGCRTWWGRVKLVELDNLLEQQLLSSQGE